MAVEQHWTAYNRRMTDLFRERDRFPVECPKRKAVAERLLALWDADGDWIPRAAALPTHTDFAQIRRRVNSGSDRPAIHA